MTIVRANIKRPGLSIGEPPPIQGGPYTANGVHFAGSIQGNGPTYLLNNSLNTGYGGDNGAFSFSFWAQNLMTDNNDGCTLWVTDPGSATVGSSVPAVGGAYNPSIETNVSSFNTELEWFDSATNASFDLSWPVFPFPNSDSNWHHYLGSVYTNQKQGTKIGLLYVDDIFIAATTGDVGPGFKPPIKNKSFIFGDDLINLAFFPLFRGFGPDMNVADVWIYPNRAIISVNKDGTNFIGEGARRTFTSIGTGGGFLVPNNPANFPAAPIIFTGPASTFGANLGFGGHFGLFGTLGDVPGPGQIPIP